MLDFFWPARHEHGFHPSPTPIQSSTASFLTQSPIAKQLKRKRDQTDDATPPKWPEPTNIVKAQSQGHDADSSRPQLFAPAGATVSPSKLATTSKAGTIAVGSPEALENPDCPSVLETSQGQTTVPNGLPPNSPSTLGHPAPLSMGLLDNLQAVRETVEAQFGLEILIKHRELRLIEQELAKCQVAYEQIRRCHVIPFPAQSSSPDNQLAVSNGSGLAYANDAPSAAPWGVIDGPYSRHYRSWLITDPSFDSTFVEEPQHQMPSGKRLPDRLTRGVHAEKGLFGASSRTQQGPISTRSTRPAHEQSDGKLEKGPMIVARKSDGHMVKLVCLDCRRSDFNSVQGFINHCRIAHSRQFVSHEAAIEASGEEVDGEKAGQAQSETVTPRQTGAANLVHPMIRAARPPSPKPTVSQGTKVSISSQPNASEKSATKQIDDRERHLSAPYKVSADFTPSSQTPYLSAFLSKLGRGDNLADVVLDAKRTDEHDLIQSMEIEESEIEDEDEDIQSAEVPSRSTRGVVQSGFRPISSGNPRPLPVQTARPPTTQSHGRQQTSHDSPFGRVKWSPPNVATGDLSFSSYDAPTNDIVSPSSNLSPGVTDPNPAPSLVSDDGEYDHTQSDSDTPNQTDLESDDERFPQPHLLDDETMDIDDHSQFGLSIPGKPHGPRFGRRRRVSRDGGGVEAHHQVSFAPPDTFVGPVGRELLHK